MTRLVHHFGGFRFGGPQVHPEADLEGLEEKVVKEYDPRKTWGFPVYDQLQLGACTANSVSSNIRRHLLLTKKIDVNPSRLDIYYGERDIEGDLRQGDTGAFGSDGFVFAADSGFVSETVWPYDINTFQTPPAAMAKAKKTTLDSKTVLVPQTKAAIHKVLSNKQSISFGFSVYRNFEGMWTTNVGDDPNIMPNPNGQTIGGHEIQLIGFLEKYPDHIIARNSWGSSWQKDGHFLFPLKLLENKKMCSDFRTIVIPL